MQKRPHPGETDAQETAPAEATPVSVEAPEETPAPISDELTRKDTEIADLKNQLLYLRADFENTKKRIEKRYRDSAEFATESLLKDILPVLDNLEKALVHSREAAGEAPAAILEGLEMIVEQLKAVLGKYGVEDVTAHGEKFDPNVHDAMVQVAGEQENQVAEVYEKGYRLKGRLLRPAKVAVTKVATEGGDG
ncbi:MAG: nucleotide exchange factor GrpE [Deltaproteobacteria bacterium]|nr:nucleotide exchange factor GrpE [Deltaproteobacteria bacterium]